MTPQSSGKTSSVTVGSTKKDVVTWERIGISACGLLMTIVLGVVAILWGNDVHHSEEIRKHELSTGHPIMVERVESLRNFLGRIEETIRGNTSRLNEIRDVAKENAVEIKSIRESVQVIESRRP